MRSRARYGSLLAAALALSLATQSVASEPARLQERTPVTLALRDDLVSGRAKVGQPVDFEVEDDVKTPNGQILIVRGARGTGKVTASSAAGMLGKSGKLEFTVDSVEAMDGTRVPLRGSIENKAGSKTGAVVAAAILLAPVALLFRGKNVTLKKGQQFTAYVDRDVMIAPTAPTSGAAAAPGVATPPTQHPPGGLGATPSGASGFDIDPKDLDALADGLRQAVDAKPELKALVDKGKVAVLTFDLVDIPSASVAKNVVEDLSTAMIQKGFSLVERAQLDRALKELKIQNSGIVDADTARQIGKAAGCEFLLVGSISDRGTFMVINARVLETETGKAVVADRKELRKLATTHR